MGWSLKIFSVRGIAVRVHFSFLLILIWAAFPGFGAGLPGRGSGPAGLLFAESFVLLLFACVVLHELAHALTAQLFDIPVQDITLWPLGGLARMGRMPESPVAELIISAAGPAMNILLTLVLGAVLLLGAGPGFGRQVLAEPWLISSLVGGWNARSMLFLLVINNAGLALFNLVPAFPMDGGRLLRALLAAFLPFATATRLAAWAGQGLAVLMLIIAVLQPQLILLAVVAIFILFAAGQERDQATTYGNLRGLRVGQAMQKLGVRLHPLQTLGQAAEQIVGSAQSVFLVVDGGQAMGILSRGDLLAGLRKHGAASRVSQQMTRDVLRLGPGESLSTARDQLIQKNAWVALVVDDGQVVGTLSHSDLNRLGDLLQAYPALLPRN